MSDWKKFFKKPILVDARVATEADTVNTFEWKMRADPGDYIIQGIEGELYPCKREIFEKFYDEVKTHPMELEIDAC